MEQIKVEVKTYGESLRIQCVGEAWVDAGGMRLVGGSR
jgi:hypothetical protein